MDFAGEGAGYVGLVAEATVFRLLGKQRAAVEENLSQNVKVFDQGKAR